MGLCTDATGYSTIVREQMKGLTCDLEDFCSNYDFILIGREKYCAPGVRDTKASGAALQAVVTCNSKH